MFQKPLVMYNKGERTPRPNATSCQHDVSSHRKATHYTCINASKSIKSSVTNNKEE